MSDLQVKIKKDISYRDFLADLDKLLTAISDIIKLDLSNSLEYPTLEVTGSMSGAGIVAISTERLSNPRNINIVGDVLGVESFDGTTDININAKIVKINNTNIDNIFESKDGRLYSKYAINADNATNATTSLSSNTANSSFNNIFTVIKSDSSGGSLHLENSGTGKNIAIENNNQVLQIYGVDLTGGNTLTFNPSNGELSASYFNGVADNSNRIAGVYCNNNLITPSGTDRLNVEGYVYATRTYVTESSDYAECFDSNGLVYEDIKNRIVEVNEDGKLQLGTFISKRVIGIVSDNYGHLLNGSEEDVKNGYKIPIGLAGVLFVDAKEKVEKNNIGNFICSDNEGYAKVLSAYLYGTVVGKIIGVDEINNRYKVLISLM